MKAMKGLSMNKMLGSIKRKPTAGEAGSGPSDSSALGEDPEAVVHRCIKLFRESGGRDGKGDEVTYLPSIVEAAESSPAAAAECARQIRKLLQRENWSKPTYQYNAVMLMRILAQNPGPTFTRNLDKKFVDVVKDVLRAGRSGNVHQILMETLDSFEAENPYDEGLAPLLEMWKKEKARAYQAYGRHGWPTTLPPAMTPPSFNATPQTSFPRQPSRPTLPNAVDLANRLEEARTSAKLLEQLVASTPPTEVLSNDLIIEFAERCQTASRSIQGYMSATDPAPDNDTMESLLDTNEQLQQALNHHQRAVLSARKQLGLGERSANPSPHPSGNDDRRPRDGRRGGAGSGSDSGAHDGGAASSARQNAHASSSRSNNAQFDDSPPVPSRSSTGKGKAAEVYHASGPSRSATNGIAHRGAAGNDDPVAGPAPVSPMADDDDDPFRDPTPGASRARRGRASSVSSASVNTGPTGGAGASTSAPGSTQQYGSAQDGAGAGGSYGGNREDDVDLYGVDDAYRGSSNKEPVYRY